MAALVLASVLLIPVSGCGIAGSATPPTLIPVKGKVTYKGKPLTKGVVKFEPDGFGRKANGQIQSDGTFVLTTAKEGDGVVAGHHQVSITGTGNRMGKELIPKKYTQRNSSDLTADVDAEHAEFNFDLK
ncbi:MAG: hypothetical protein ACP5XB_00300 [Isosphaeraceae bacterium]